MRKHLQAEADSSAPPLDPAAPARLVVLAESGLGKGAETVARRITQTIVAEGCSRRPRRTEPELIARERRE